jgi:hypothetical protein
MFTDLLAVDDDLGWNPADAVRLIQSDLTIAGGVYRRKQDLDMNTLAAWAVAFEIGEAEQTECGAFSAAGGGLGFVKINRKVFEDIASTHELDEMPRATAIITEEDAKKFAANPTIKRYCHFEKNLGEDLVLFRNAREAGHKFWFYPDIALTHVGEYEYKGSISEMADLWHEQHEQKQAAE